MSAKLRPMTLVIRGAPKHEASPISGLPLSVTETSATKSATELPMASTVSPRMAVVCVCERDEFGMSCIHIVFTRYRN